VKSTHRRITAPASERVFLHPNRAVFAGAPLVMCYVSPPHGEHTKWPLPLWFSVIFRTTTERRARRASSPVSFINCEFSPHPHPIPTSGVSATAHQPEIDIPMSMYSETSRVAVGSLRSIPYYLRACSSRGVLLCGSCRKSSTPQSYLDISASPYRSSLSILPDVYIPVCISLREIGFNEWSV